MRLQRKYAYLTNYTTSNQRSRSFISRPYLIRSRLW